MAVPTAQRLLEAAEQGKKLTARERRLVVAYIKATQPEISNTDMAERFGVHEKTIRTDLLTIRRDKAKFLKNDDIGLVIADIALDFEHQVADIEQSKAKAKKGTGIYLQHCQSILELRLKMVKAFQDIGYLPKNLGNMTVEKYEYKAIVSKQDGSVVGTEIRDNAPYIDAELVEPKKLEENNENASTGPQSEEVGCAGSDSQNEGS